jgi:hypothetical protein
VTGGRRQWLLWTELRLSLSEKQNVKSAWIKLKNRRWINMDLVLKVGTQLTVNGKMFLTSIDGSTSDIEDKEDIDAIERHLEYYQSRLPL